MLRILYERIKADRRVHLVKNTIVHIVERSDALRRKMFNMLQQYTIVIKIYYQKQVFDVIIFFIMILLKYNVYNNICINLKNNYIIFSSRSSCKSRLA